MATRFTCSISLAIQGAYEQGTSFVDVVQLIESRYESGYVDGNGIAQADVVFAIGTTNTGTIQTYDLAPMSDVFGNAKTWSKLRTIIVKSHDDPSVSRRLLLGGTAWANTHNLSVGSAQQIVRASALHCMDSPGTVSLTPIIGGSIDTITITGSGGASEANPIPYDLWLIGTEA